VYTAAVRLAGRGEPQHGRHRLERAPGHDGRLSGLPQSWRSDRDGGRNRFHRRDAGPRDSAFDVETGRELWKADLPAGARATPMTYEAAGRQFVVIAAGGGGPFGAGDAIVAFALPPLEPYR